MHNWNFSWWSFIHKPGGSLARHVFLYLIIHLILFFDPNNKNSSFKMINPVGTELIAYFEITVIYVSLNISLSVFWIWKCMFCQVLPNDVLTKDDGQLPMAFNRYSRINLPHFSNASFESENIFFVCLINHLLIGCKMKNMHLYIAIRNSPKLFELLQKSGRMTQSPNMFLEMEVL